MLPPASTTSVPRRDREEFKARVLEWAAKLDVKAHSIYVRPMRRKWASCSTAGTLSFNDELLGMDTKLGDYVIVHELLHFSVPNHGKLWKALMRAHLGDYEHLSTSPTSTSHIRAKRMNERDGQVRKHHIRPGGRSCAGRGIA